MLAASLRSLLGYRLSLLIFALRKGTSRRPGSLVGWHVRCGELVLCNHNLISRLDEPHRDRGRTATRYRSPDAGNSTSAAPDTHDHSRYVAPAVHALNEDLQEPNDGNGGTAGRAGAGSCAVVKRYGDDRVA